METNVINTTAQETTTLKVRVKERKTADGRAFLTYTTFSKNGRRTDLKFRRDVKNIPTEDCSIICPIDAVNINTSGEYPVCWVAAISEIIPIGERSDDQIERDRAAVRDYFG